MSTEDAYPPSSSPGRDTAGAAPPSRTSSPTKYFRARRGLAAALAALLFGAAGIWLAHSYWSRAEPEAGSEDALALDIIGGWWNITGDRHLALEWEGRRATLHDYSRSEAGVESVGSWRTTKNIVIVHVSGAAGTLDQELELVGNDVEMFLAPTPSAQARLFDSWIAEHEDDDEDMSPSDSTPRETRAWMMQFAAIS